MTDLLHRRILFVCLGNICRSPLAEGVFLHRARALGVEESLVVDSAGTGAWHAGERPDPRSIDVARKYGVSLPGRARQLREADFRDFDLILAMDRENFRNIDRMRGSARGSAELRLFREFDPEAGDDLEIPDPYYGGPEGFDRVFEMVDRAGCGLLEFLFPHGGAGAEGGKR